jgi:hypothetical protein
MTQKYAGGCMCGAVTYVANGAPIVVAQCHCEECRRLSGTGHSVGAMFSTEMVSIAGDLNEYRYLSGADSHVTKGFCATCGSPISGINTRLPNHITLPLGSMDDARDLAIQVVIFERDKPHWDQLLPEVSRFSKQPDWTPET